MSDNLTAKERRFIEEYLIDLNGTQAAIRAGYSVGAARQIAAVKMTKVVIRAQIDAALKERSERLRVTQDQVIQELKLIGFSRMKTFARWNVSGVSFKDSDELTDEESACILEITETTNQHGGALKLKLHSKVEALRLLGQHIGMFKGDVEDEEPEEYTRPESMRRK